MPELHSSRIARDLHMVAALTRRVLERGLEDPREPITFTQLAVLKWLDAATPRRAQGVARYLSASAPAATQILARLKQKGLVRTRPNKEDRRAGDLRLTARGHALVRKHDALKRERLERMLEALPMLRQIAIAEGLEGAIELLLKADPLVVDMCLHCGVHSSPHCVMRRHGMRCPTEQPCGALPTSEPGSRGDADTSPESNGGAHPRAASPRTRSTRRK
jgi:DNA-binding MarR family transcriptional regulator